MRRTWRTTDSRRSHPPPGSEVVAQLKIRKIFRENLAYLQRFFPVGFLLVHIDTEADSKHLGFQICPSDQSLSDLLALELILKMSDIGELD